MRTFALTVGDAFRGVVALALIALAMGIVAPVSIATAILMVVAAISLVSSGAGRPVFGRARRS